jgi:hypothetical protein
MPPAPNDLIWADRTYPVTTRKYRARARPEPPAPSASNVVAEAVVVGAVGASTWLRRLALIGCWGFDNDLPMDLVCVTVDCADPSAVAGFWSEALGWRDIRTAPDGAGAVCRPPLPGAYVEFVRVPEAKTVKNRLHFGCTAGDLDRLEDEIERLVALGATVAWEERFPTEVSAVYRNVVLRDVEGNEFCLGAGHLPSGRD